jgi:putative membrane protein
MRILTRESAHFVAPRRHFLPGKSVDDTEWGIDEIATAGFAAPWEGAGHAAQSRPWTRADAARTTRTRRAMKLLVRWLLLAAALLLVAHLSPGVAITSFATALGAALVLGLLNMLVRPLLVLLTLPVTVLTLGLFLFVINALMFWAAAGLLRGFQVDNFLSALIGSLIYSVASTIIDVAIEHLFED